jgi:EKC/KEOPS complex subunit PCC1/LAGE3
MAAILSHDFIEPPSFQSRPAADPHSQPTIQPKHAFSHTMRVTYPTAESASIAYNSVSVDDEIRPDRIYRHMRIEENVLVCYFSASELKFLRVAISAFLEMLALATETLAQFALSEHN